MSFIKLLSFACAALLVLAMAKMPGGYYVFLRLIVTVCSVAIIMKKVKNLHALWLVLFVVAALLYNPVIPVYFYKKSLWTPINIISALLFAGYGLSHKNKIN